MGGYATKEMGTRPVDQNEIPGVLAVLSILSDVPIAHFRLLGSTGKFPTSNDVDLAVDSNLYPFDKVHAQLSSILGPAAKYNHGTGVGSYAIPVILPTPENPEPDRAQVDIMFTPNVKWAKFAYHSPDFLHSEYKGAVRTLLLMGVAANVAVKGYDMFYYTDGLLIGRVGRTLDLNRGLRRIYQYRPRRKDDTDFLKSMKTVHTIEEVEEGIGVKFDTVTHRCSDFVFDDPKQALAIMFDRPVQPEEVDDAESVLRLIRVCFDKEKQEDIFTKAANRAKSIQDKMKLPPEITRYL